jgi:hypothetical protein
MHSIILVWALGVKTDFRGLQGGVGVDIFSVLALRVSTWVTYSPQDSVQRLLLYSRSSYSCSMLLRFLKLLRERTCFLLRHLAPGDARY